jgi:hypothetical protein
MAGPGDEIAAGAGGPNRMLASHADREQAVEVLKAAFVQGRLDSDEFDLRVGQALGARTCAELAALTADLPAGQAAAQAPGSARVRAGQPVLRPGRIIGVATVLYAGVWAVVILLPIPAVGVLTIASLLYYMIVVLIASEHASASRRQMRSGGQPPQGPAPSAGDQAPRPPLSADPDNAGRPSAREVHPEWQDLALGDYLKFWAPGRGPMDAYGVAALEPNRFLGLYGLSDLRGRRLDPKQPRPSAYMEGLWGFQLNELPGERTRLVIGGYQAIRPRWMEVFAFFWVFPPVVWIMQVRMLAVLKRNIERAAKAEAIRR